MKYEATHQLYKNLNLKFSFYHVKRSNICRKKMWVSKSQLTTDDQTSDITENILYRMQFLSD